MSPIETQLEYLNETMKGVLSEGNAFLLKYYFGGIVAVLALLNMDLVLIDPVRLAWSKNLRLVVAAIIFILVLSCVYFWFVLERHAEIIQSHRKLKYKYELTLHALLSEGSNGDYQYYIEQAVTAYAEGNEDEIEKPRKGTYDFKYIAGYLLNHHRIKYHLFEERKQNFSYLVMAMVIIVLTLTVRIIFFVLSG